MPASSHCCTRSMLLSQLLSQRSSTLVTAMPPEQLAENVPSLSLFAELNRGEVTGSAFPGLGISSWFAGQQKVRTFQT